MPYLKIKMTDEYHAYIKEQAAEKKRTMSKFGLYAVERYCNLNPLQREKEERQKIYIEKEIREAIQRIIREEIESLIRDEISKLNLESSSLI